MKFNAKQNYWTNIEVVNIIYFYIEWTIEYNAFFV